MRVAAYVSHRLPGRARLKFPSRRGAVDFFEALMAGLQGCPGIIELQGKPTTASLLIWHDPSTALETILDYAQRRELFRCEDPAPPPPTKVPSISTLASQSMGLLDSGLSAASKGRVDLPSVYFLTFLGLGARELARGHIMPPAVTLVWRSLEILSKINPRSP